MLYEVLKTAKMGAGKAPDLYTALLAKNLRRDGEVKTLSGIPPLTFRSNGQPLLDYLISGNTVQSGTPTPDNPVTPQGTGERTGNLCQLYKTGYYIDSSGTERENANFSIYSAKIPSSGDYTLSCTYSSGGSTTVRIHSYSGGSWQQRLVEKDLSSTPITITATSGIDEIRISINNAAQNVMLNTGSTALPYEPYGVKIPISSADTTTPVYLGEVESTRQIKKLVLDGTETISYSSSNNTFVFNLNNGYYTGSVRTTPLFCSHYIHIDDGRPFANMPNNSIYIASYGSATGAYIYSTNYADLADFKTYLAQQYAAGTPVTVWYVLATEETAVVNEPLMKIGSYADSISMEQAGVQIPTAKGSTTLDVETMVKPSEVYIKYKS